MCDQTPPEQKLKMTEWENDENLKNNALTSFIDLDRDLDTRCFGVYVMLEMVAIFSMVLKMFHWIHVGVIHLTQC